MRHILRVSPIFYAKKWRMLILVKICRGGSLNSTFCQIYSPVFRKNIFANLDSQNYFCSTLTKTKASEISSGPVPDGVIF